MFTIVQRAVFCFLLLFFYYFTSVLHVRFYSKYIKTG